MKALLFSSKKIHILLPRWKALSHTTIDPTRYQERLQQGARKRLSVSLSQIHKTPLLLRWQLRRENERHGTGCSQQRTLQTLEWLAQRCSHVMLRNIRKLSINEVNLKQSNSKFSLCKWRAVVKNIPVVNLNLISWLMLMVLVSTNSITWRCCLLSIKKAIKIWSSVMSHAGVCK